MADDLATETPNRQAERVDATVEVGLEFDSFQGFLSEYSSNISTSGMFVKTTSPPPMGTVLRFTLKLKGDFQLIKGTGEVTWVRMQSQGPRLPAGMGIRFLAIPDSGVDLIQKMVERYREQGGRPFEVQADAQALPPQQAQQPEELEQPEQPARGLLPGTSPDIFIPPDIVPKPSPPAEPSPVELVKSRAAARAPRRIRLSLVIFLLLGSGAAGALSFAFGERLVNWASGYDNSLDQPQVFDLPPPVTLTSQQVETVLDVGERPPSLAQTPTDEELSASIDVGSSGPALNQVRLITWKGVEGGGTLVTFWGDGLLSEQNLVHVRFGEQPVRELLKLRGVNWPFRDPVLEVDSPEVRRIRTGFHPKPTLNELHIVIDLADPDVRLVRLERGLRNVELLFQH